MKLSISVHQHFTSVNVMTLHFSSMSDGPCNFKGVIISSLHGWIILSFHPFLRFLDSSDSFKFPYYNTPCSKRLSSLFINNLSSQSWSCSSPFSIPPSITPFTFWMSKHCWYKGKNLPLFSHHFSEQVMFCFMPAFQCTHSSPKKSLDTQVSHTVYHTSKLPVPFIYFFTSK